MSVETITIAKINGVSILVNQDQEKRVAIKPICQILGIDYSRQLKKIKEDYIMEATVGSTPTVAADGIIRNMTTIPFKQLFVWLLKINAKNVKEEAKEDLIKYQRECYDVLYNYFSAKSEFVEARQIQIEAQLDILNTAKTNFKSARTILNEAETQLKKIRSFTFEDFQAEKSQTKMDF